MTYIHQLHPNPAKTHYILQSAAEPNNKLLDPKCLELKQLLWCQSLYTIWVWNKPVKSQHANFICMQCWIILLYTTTLAQSKLLAITLMLILVHYTHDLQDHSNFLWLGVSGWTWYVFRWSPGQLPWTHRHFWTLHLGWLLLRSPSKNTTVNEARSRLFWDVLRVVFVSQWRLVEI